MKGVNLAENLASFKSPISLVTCDWNPSLQKSVRYHAINSVSFHKISSLPPPGGCQLQWGHHASPEVTNWHSLKKGRGLWFCLQSWFCKPSKQAQKHIVSILKYFWTTFHYLVAVLGHLLSSLLDKEGCMINQQINWNKTKVVLPDDRSIELS